MAAPTLISFWKICVIHDFIDRRLTLHDGDSYHKETSPLIYTAGQWTGFCMRGTSVIKKLSPLFWLVNTCLPRSHLLELRQLPKTNPKSTWKKSVWRLFILYNKYHCTKMKFSIKDFFSKCDQILGNLRIWPHLLKKSLMENFTFCAVLQPNGIVSSRKIYKLKQNSTK